MLDAVLESLDKNIFTPEVVDQIHEEFQKAVDNKVLKTLEERDAALEHASSQYKNELDNAFNESIQTYKADLNERIEQYLNKAVENFVDENVDKLDKIIECSKGDALLSVFERISNILGKDITESLDLSTNTHKVRELRSDYEAQINSLSRKIRELEESVIKNDIERSIERYENLTLVESNNLRNRVKNIIKALPKRSRSSLGSREIGNICERALRRMEAEADMNVNDKPKATNKSNDSWARFI